MKSRRRNLVAAKTVQRHFLLAIASGWVCTISLAPQPLQAATLGINAGLDSEAMLRGISQSGGRPSLRLGFEIESDAGPYAGLELATVLSKLQSQANAAGVVRKGRCLQVGDPGYTGAACSPSSKAHLPTAANASQPSRDRRVSFYVGTPLISTANTLMVATVAQHYYAVGNSLERDYRELRLESSLDFNRDVFALTNFIADNYYGSRKLTGGLEASHTRQLFTGWRTQIVIGAVASNDRTVPDYGYGRIGLLWSQHRLGVSLYGHATQSSAKAFYGQNLVRPRATLLIDYRLF